MSTLTCLAYGKKVKLSVLFSLRCCVVVFSVYKIAQALAIMTKLRRVAAEAIGFAVIVNSVSLYW